MKKYLDKYYNFIGIKNEGFRRIVSLVLYFHLIVIIIFQVLTWLPKAIQMWMYNVGILGLRVEWDGFLYHAIIPFITYTILFKLIAWIVDGFKD